MPSIRFHNKSRHGCEQCKTRKVKCDETRPICRRCDTKRTRCSFQQSDSPTTLSLLGHSPVGALKSPERSLRQPYIDLDDLQHFQFFLLDTAASLTFKDGSHDVWQRVVPSLACSDTYLLHCLLAFAALHRASTDSDVTARQRRLQTARDHEAEALPQFIAALDEMNASNCVSLSCFNTLFALMPYAWYAASPSNAINVFTSSAKLNRGTDTIINQHWELISTSEIGLIFRHPDFEQLPPLPQGAARSLDLLTQRVMSVTDYHKQHLYDHALQRLYRAVRSCGAATEQAYALTYPTHMTKEVLALLEDRDEFVLAVLAIWAAFMNSLSSRWWVGRWPQDCVSEVASILPLSWSSVLEWPRSVFTD